MYILKKCASIQRWSLTREVAQCGFCCTRGPQGILNNRQTLGYPPCVVGMSLHPFCAKSKLPRTYWYVQKQSQKIKRINWYTQHTWMSDTILVQEHNQNSWLWMASLSVDAVPLHYQLGNASYYLNEHRLVCVVNASVSDHFVGVTAGQDAEL